MIVASGIRDSTVLCVASSCQIGDNALITFQIHRRRIYHLGVQLTKITSGLAMPVRALLTILAGL